MTPSERQPTPKPKRVVLDLTETEAFFLYGSFPFDGTPSFEHPIERRIERKLAKVMDEAKV
jgi:hypothetical protein